MNNSLQTMYIEMVEKALDRYVSTQRCNNDHVLEAMRYSVLGGGKRIRPVLTLEFRPAGGHRLASGSALCLRPGAGTQLFPDPRRSALHGR